MPPVRPTIMLAKVGSPCIFPVTIFSYLICVVLCHHSGDYFLISNLCSTMTSFRTVPSFRTVDFSELFSHR
ncbi:hypothetical protein H5410_041983 [Solanum commersonii]|uniref:Uncharacterized protein n=1 Tax=Solanum commersonii TaxID=4109 RepID=A0A9J5XUF8_SOLCO|nr:hypothetical protein H5410_041983 [Solanum commersonii]